MSISGKVCWPFNLKLNENRATKIMTIQVYTQHNNTREVQIERFYKKKSFQSNSK